MLTTVLSPNTQLVEIHIATPASEWRGKWTHLEVYRSVLGESGPWEAFFSQDADTPARLPASAGNRSNVDGRFVDLSGNPLSIRIGGTTWVFEHAGPYPMSSRDVAVQVELAVPVNAWVDAEGQFVLETKQLGSGALLEVLPSDAAYELGLPTDPPGSTGVGKSRPVALQPMDHEVVVVDPFGQDDYAYRCRYAAGAAKSEWSAIIIPATSRSAVPVELRAQGYIRMMSKGTPLANQRVVVRPIPNYNTEWVEVPEDQEQLTDKNGRAEFSLVRGTQYDLVVVGTGIIRRVRVPMTGEGPFYLLGPEVTQDDGMSIQKLDIEYADRRNL